MVQVQMTKQTIRLRDLSADDYDWLPPAVRFPGRRLTFDYRSNKAARAQFGKAEHIDLTDFIRSIPVLDGACVGGCCDPDRYPYQVHALKIFTHPCIRKGVVTGGNQSGKSKLGEMLLAFWAAYNPGNVIVYYPDQYSVQHKFSQSLIPFFKHKNYKHLCTGVEDDLNKKIIQLRQMAIFAGWTSSLAHLSTKSAKYLINEEAEKSKETVAVTEAAVKFLMDGRLRDHGDEGVQIDISTLSVPSGPTSKARAAVEVQFDFLPTCPYCHKQHQVDDKYLDYIVNSKLFGPASKPQNVRYVCPHCQKKWTEQDRQAALLAGSVRAREVGWQAKVEKGDSYTHDPRLTTEYLNAVWPSSAALTVPALIMPTVSLQDVAEVVEAAKTDIQAAQNLENHYRDLPFKSSAYGRSPDEIIARTWGQPKGICPPAEEIAYILAGVDVQQKSVYYSVVAFGWSYTRNRDYCRPTSWILDTGQIDTVDQHRNALPLAGILAQIERMQFVGADGSTERNSGLPYGVDALCVDLRGKNAADGGGRTEEVKAWAAETLGSNRRLLQWGEGTDMKGRGYEISYTNNPLQPEYLLPYLRADRNELEKWLETGLMLEVQDQGAVLVYEGLPLDHAQHINSTQLNARTGRYGPVPGQRRDIRDTVRYAALAYLYLLDYAVKHGGPAAAFPPWMR